MASLSLPTATEARPPMPALAEPRAGAGGLSVIGFGDPVAADYVAYASHRTRDDIVLADETVGLPAGPNVRAVSTEALSADHFEALASLVIFLPPNMTDRRRHVLERVVALAADCSPAFVCIVRTGEAFGDESSSQDLDHCLRRLRNRVGRIVALRPGHILSPHSRPFALLRKLGACYPLVPRRIRGCCIEGNELFEAIEQERRAALNGVFKTHAGGMDKRTRLPMEQPAEPGKHGQASALAHFTHFQLDRTETKGRRSRRPRVYMLLGPNRPWRDWLAEHRARGPVQLVVTVTCQLLALLGVGQLAALLISAAARRWPSLRRLNIGTLQPCSFRQLLALYNKYNYHYVKVVGYNNGVNHFGHRYPGKTVVSTVRLGRVVRAGQNSIRADCGATIRKARDSLTAAGQDLYVIPNYSYVCLGTAFFVPIHGSAAAYSCVADTISKVVLYDPVLDRMISTTRDEPDFRDRVYDLTADVLLLRLNLNVKPQSRYYAHAQELEDPGADLLLDALRDSRAANAEVRKSKAAGSAVQVIKYYNDAGDSESPVLELPRDSLGRLWDRLEENPVTSFLMHALTRQLAFHVELFFTPEEFATFWNDHRGLPLRKIQLRYIKRDGLPRSPFRDHDCVSADTFMFRRHRGVFEEYLKRTFTVVRANPGKHSV